MAPRALVELLHVYTVPLEEKLRFAGVDDDTIAHQPTTASEPAP